MQQLNDVPKVAIKKKQRREEDQTLLLLWACQCLTKQRLNIFTRQFDNILVQKKHIERNLITNRVGGLKTFNLTRK